MMFIRRIVYERGIEVISSSEGGWFYSASGNPCVSCADPWEASRRFDVRPMLITHSADKRPESHEQVDLLLPNSEQFALRLSALQQRGIGLVPRLKYAPISLNYLLGGLAYHCQQLVESYANTCASFSRVPFSDSDRVTFSWSRSPYYEFEAILGIARRAYETLRHFLHACGPGTESCPGSFRSALKRVSGVPPILLDRLERSWAAHGTKLKAYRDCIHHYCPVSTPLFSLDMVRLDGAIWSASARIPDNPDARTPSKFTFERRLDAASYAWEIVAEIVSISEATFDAFDE